MNSVLNPEAPEFHPLMNLNMTSISQGGCTAVKKSIRSSNKMPSGASYLLFKTYTDFNVVSCKFSKNVNQQSNTIIRTELPKTMLKKDDLEENMEKVVDCNDCMLDRMFINLDQANGTASQVPQMQPNVSSWNANPAPVKIQFGSATFLCAKNIPRPQLLFKDQVDNSESLWVPKITDKPNNTKPLALTIMYNDHGEAVGYEHPYKVELNSYHPPTEMLSAVDLAFPPLLEQTNLTIVTTEQEVDDLVSHLATVKEIAVDVEHHFYRSYQGITCLIQITTDEGGDFIIDTIAAREHIHKLNVIFTDPRKIKVFHGADMDVQWLQRDFGVYVVGMFDTQKAAKQLKLNGLSLKYLLHRYCDVDTDKKYQLADWRIRPLPDELIKYARMDTHYLLYIWRLMKNILLKNAGGMDHFLISVFDQSRRICKLTYNKPVVLDDSHMKLYIQSKKSFNSQQLAALKMLYKWRDTNARELDESTVYLLPNHMLLALAECLPREIQGVNACCTPMPPFVKQNLITLHRILLSCREMPLEPQLYNMPSSISELVNSVQPTLAYEVHDYSHLPTHNEELSIDLDRAADHLEDKACVLPDVTMFQLTPDKPKPLGSRLNVDAKMYIPPYDRYRKYRTLAQIEEIKEFKEKEAKIAAIGKGNEIIQTEVIMKLQKAASNIEKESNTQTIDVASGSVTESNSESKQVNKANPATQPLKGKRKRRITNEKVEPKKPQAKQTEKPDDCNRNDSKNKNNANVKAFTYKNVNYKKFYDESDKGNKIQKFKKRK